VKKLKRIISTMLALVLTVTILPQTSVVDVNAAEIKATASLPVLGYTKTPTQIGGKEQDEKWLQTNLKIGESSKNTRVFCLDLGETCRTGDEYSVNYNGTSSWNTWTTASTNTKHKLYTYIAHWYCNKVSNKRWIYAQALIWSVREGYTSKDQLKAVIKQLIDDPVVSGSTNYGADATTEALYNQIFDGDAYSVDYRVWKNENNNRQDLIEFKKDEDIVDWTTLTREKKYRQRVTVYKKDEFSNPLPNVQFTLTIKNIMELDNLKAGNGDSAETIDGDDIKANTFSSTVTTGNNGLAYWKITYGIESKEIGYVKAAKLEKMNADQKNLVIQQMNAQDIPHPDSLKYDDAVTMANTSINNQFNKISNKYTLKEDSTGNTNILVSPEYASGKAFALGSNYSWMKADDGWPDVTDKSYWNYQKAYVINPITNNHKKITINVKKSDDNSSDGTPRGDLSLANAEFRFYDDQNCTKVSTVYNSNGTSKTCPVYKTDSKGELRTDYLISGNTYWVKEIKAPEGYKVDPTPKSVKVTSNSSAEFSNSTITVPVTETSYKGTFELTKYHALQKTGEISSESIIDGLSPEEGAQFQVYLKSRGSYDAAKAEEKDLLICDKNGYAKTKKLPYGTYVVHQIGTGTNPDGTEVDAEMILDQEFKILEDGQEIKKAYVNEDFSAYLRVVKKLKETNETVLKANTSYEIYKVAVDGTETKVEQEYVDNEEIKTTSVFTTDETGLIETYKPLIYGTYRIYEIEGAEGTHKFQDYIEIKISSKNGLSKQFTDAEGNTYYEAQIEYVNDSTKGVFTIAKTGEKLVSFSAEDGFKYEQASLDNAVFKLYASEDIMTADGQGTTWFKEGDLVATITTGKGAEFTSDCNGICSFEKMKNGDIKLFLPLGTYHVTESDAPYGYFVADEESNDYELKFVWENFIDPTVNNSTTATNENSVLEVVNSRKTANLSIYKGTKDKKEMAVEGCVYGVYTKDNIYNYKGELIAKAGDLLTTVTTDAEGYATVGIDLPAMDEHYNAEDEDGKLNSGDYYFVEQEVSKSYYIDEEPINVHIENSNDDASEPVAMRNANDDAKDDTDDTTVEDDNKKYIVITSDNLEYSKFYKLNNINLMAAQVDEETVVDVSKFDLGGTALKGASLSVADSKGNTIISWVTGDKDSIKVDDKVKDLTYVNLYAEMNEDGNITIHGLLHDEEYSLVETRPADGYVTAESIKFKVLQEETEVDGNVTKKSVTKVYNKETQAYENVDAVKMYDDTNKVKLSKVNITNEQELPGCKLEVRDSEGNVIDSWTSTNEPHYMEKMLITGATYTLVETQPADGFTTAQSIEFVVRDTGEVQTVTMVDAPTKVEFSKTTITGEKELPGCDLKVIDKDTGKTVDSWTSTKETHIIEGELIVGKTYTLSETKPADGYTTATDIDFVVEDNLGKVQTVQMKDDVTKIKIVKVDADSERRLANAEFKFTDKDGKVVATITTDANGEAMVEGKLVVGKTYTLTETKAPDGYELAGNFKYKVKDTTDIQVIKVKDKPKTPHTGLFMKGNSLGYMIMALIAGIGIVLFGGKKKKKLARVRIR
jgi:hypothetical protein